MSQESTKKNMKMLYCLLLMTNYHKTKLTVKTPMQIWLVEIGTNGTLLSTALNFHDFVAICQNSHIKFANNSGGSTVWAAGPQMYLDN